MSLTEFTDDTPTQVDRAVRVGKVLPTTCKRGQLFFLVGTVNKIYASFTLNVWTEIANSAGSLPASPTNSIQFNNSGVFGGSADITWDGVSFFLGTPVAAQAKIDIHAIANSTVGPSYGGFIQFDDISTTLGAPTGLAVIALTSDNAGSPFQIEGLYVHVVNLSSGTLNNSYGIRIDEFSTVGTTINSYGLFITDQAGASNNWAIKTGIGLVEFGDHCKANSLTTIAKTVATLPAAPVAGQRSFVTDSNAASFTLGIGAVVAAGGATKVPVVYDGTNWRIG